MGPIAWRHEARVFPASPLQRIPRWVKVQKTLPALLSTVSKETVKEIEQQRSIEALVYTRVPYVKNEVRRFEYNVGEGIGLGSSSVPVEKEEWHWTDERGLFNCIDKVEKEVPEYSACISQISKHYGVSDAQAGFWLSRFVQSVASEAVNRDIEDEFLVDRVSTFIRDLDNAALSWSIALWLDGMWLQDEQYEIEDDFILRRPRPSDFETEVRFDELVRQPPSPFPVWHPSAILEFGFRTSRQPEVQLEIETILDVLRLFRLGSVTSLRQRVCAESILALAYESCTASAPSTTYRYTLTDADLDALRAFMCKMRPLLRQYPPYGPSAERSDPLIIALHRYKDALLHPPTPAERKMTSAITCLEALYLKAKERAELSHRLSQRASALLRFVGFKPLKVYTELRRGYEIRSTFVHGSEPEEDLRGWVRKLGQRIPEYARVSLVAFMRLLEEPVHEEKDRLINKLDHSLLDEKALREVQQLVQHESMVIPL